jgi:hypothetical protein
MGDLVILHAQYTCPEKVIWNATRIVTSLIEDITAIGIDASGNQTLDDLSGPATVV